MEDAAQDTMSGVPQSTPDAPGAASTGSDDLSDVEPDEEDWQFSEEIRHEDDEAVDTECDLEDDEDFENDLDPGSLADDDISAELDVSGSMDSTEAHGLDDLGSRSDSGLDLESTLESDLSGIEREVADEESVFGSAKDFSTSNDEEEATPFDPATEIVSELEEPSGSALEDAGVYSSSGATDDLGDPESWDLVGNHDAAVSQVAIGSIGTSNREGEFGSGETLADDSSSFEYDEEVGPASRNWQILARWGHGIGWALTVVFVTAAFGVAFHSEWSRLTQSPQTVTAGPMTAQTTNASWVETSRSGYVLVVDGELQNTGPIPVRPGLVQLIMLDAAGQRMGELPMLAGERLPESVLREASPEQLMASAAMAVSTLRDTPLAPGESRPFEVVALEADLPEDARRFLLEIGYSAIVVAPNRSDQLDEESSDFLP